MRYRSDLLSQPMLVLRFEGLVGECFRGQAELKLACLSSSSTQALLLLSRWAVRRGWLCWLCWLLVKIEFKGFLGWIAKPQRQRASFSKAQSHLKSFRDNIDAILTKIFSIFRIFSKMPKIYEIIFRFTIHFSVIRNYFQYFSLRYWKIFLFNINIGAKIIRRE